MSHPLHFTKAGDLAPPRELIERARAYKRAPWRQPQLGAGRSLLALYFNSSLRTRLSTEAAARHLGLQATTMNAGSGWQLEFGDGVVMDGDRPEHIREAAAVMSQYADILAVRSFPELIDRERDYRDPILSAFIAHARVPVVSLESATRHPLQSLADALTIAELERSQPKIVLTWAPHVRKLPQSVANSFAEWMLALGHNLTIACPPGYELAPAFTEGATVTHDQRAAFRDADIIYAKNWSSYREYGQILPVAEDWQITSEKMALTPSGQFMHCLPVRRNVVVADAVLDSAQSLVIEQARNRVFAAQAVLAEILRRGNREG